uniref:Membrane lipoprotein n=1 Tax=Oryza meridionalis TaxID=40149 RepID=A0A0E0E6D4_9ORYZ
MPAAKKITLLQTVAFAGVFSAVSCWYGFMFGRESARRELGGIIEDLRSSGGGSGCSTNSAASPDSDAHSKP